ncbi:MAG: CAF17-like 4Fe-4S cluster assembly/insertion protein YgfZ [Galactobacter sp.]|uniref:CAF17-like 4Fe-4S cluster assembly/insertion protein YgfZ n=1 Tax=Galactobacter sp. TaxID=2676125 RepID=UPI0025B7EC0B|nr:glycine cleavage T C-terminal barrel domain-containing protein [Galactobacter sp.]
MTHNNDSTAASTQVGAASPYRSPLLDLDGAVEAAGAGVADHYGAPLREGRALADGRAFVDLSHFGVVTVTGPDRLSWLHSLSSQALTGLPEGTSTRTLFLDLQGRIEFDARVVDQGGTAYLILEPGLAAGLAAWLDSMRFMLRVEVADVSERWAVLATGGEWPADAAAAASSGIEWVDPWPDIPAGGYPYGPVEDHPGFETERRLVLVPRESLTIVAQALQEAGWRPAGLDAYEQVRIAAWQPSQAHEMDNKSIPHELDLLRSAVHLNKGCYKGQETVARVHNLGHPPRRLVFLDLDGMEHTVPAAGSAVMADGRKVGTVTSSVLHHDAGPIALAVIRRAVDPGLELSVVDGETSYTAAQTVIVAPEAGSVVGRPQGIKRL